MSSLRPSPAPVATPKSLPGDTIAAMTSHRRRLRIWPFRISISCLVLVFAAALHAQAGALPDATDATPSSTDGPLQQSHDYSRPMLISNETVLRMHKAGIGDNVLVQMIRTQPGHYDLNPDDLIDLKKQGLSDKVIEAMQQHTLPDVGSGLATHPVPTAASRLTAEAAGLDEIGVFYKGKTGEWIPLHTERVVFKQGGAAKSVLTHGIISKDMNGHLEGPKSPLVLPTGVEILIYAPAGTAGDEYQFLRLVQKSTWREFRVETGGVFHSETGSDRDQVDFHPVKVGPQLYTFTVPVDIIKGEYGVLPPGSSNVKGIEGSGKIFTFSIIE
jgi:hypothetical protein